MTQTSCPKTGRGLLWARKTARLVGVLLVAVLLLGVGREAARADKGERPSRMLRQIGVMEKILDQLLVDSPNYLVHPPNVCRGIYLPEFGVLFSFEASLTDAGKGLSSLSRLKDAFSVQTNEKGDQVIVLKSGDDEDSTDVADLLKKQDARGDKTYRAGKEELLQALLDYGETMSELKDGQWLAVAAFLDKIGFFEKGGITHLVLKAKIEDLRAFSAQKLTENEVRARIQVEEY